VDTRGYEKIDGYPHNGYLTDMGTGTGQIFIQRVGYGGATTRTLPAPLTSLGIGTMISVLAPLTCKFKKYTYPLFVGIHF